MSEPAAREVFGEYAGFVTRLCAFAIDALILALVTFVVTWAWVLVLQYLEIDVLDCPPPGPEFVPRVWLCHAAIWLGVAAGSVFPSVYTLFFWSTTGQTPGKAVMGVRVVRIDGGAMHLGTALLRLVGYGISLAVFGLGFLPILVDDRRQDLADKLAGTCVVYAWRGRRFVR